MRAVVETVLGDFDVVSNCSRWLEQPSASPRDDLEAESSSCDLQFSDHVLPHDRNSLPLHFRIWCRSLSLSLNRVSCIFAPSASPRSASSPVFRTTTRPRSVVSISSIPDETIPAFYFRRTSTYDRSHAGATEGSRSEDPGDRWKPRYTRRISGQRETTNRKPQGRNWN